MDDGKKNIVYAVPPKPWSEMSKEEIFEMGGGSVNLRPADSWVEMMTFVPKWGLLHFQVSPNMQTAMYIVAA